MRKILIVDTSDVICDTLFKSLSIEFSVMCCRDGQTALELLNNFQPDLLVIDLSVSQIDGLQVIRTARLSGRNIQILVTTPNNSCYIMKCLQNMLVDQVFLRPCLVDSLLCSIRTMALEESLAYWDPAVEADHILMQLGFRMGYGMYTNTHTAIMMKYSGNTGTLMKQVYPDIAAQIRGNTLQVEKSIRDAIRRAHKTGNAAIWKLYFGDSVEGQCPSNELFITRIARALQAREQVGRPKTLQRNIRKNA